MWQSVGLHVVMVAGEVWCSDSDSGGDCMMQMWCRVVYEGMMQGHHTA